MSRLPGGRRIDVEIVRGLLKQAKKELSEATPAYVCPECHGDGCGVCDGYGWLTRKGFEGLS